MIKYIISAVSCASLLFGVLYSQTDKKRIAVVRFDDAALSAQPVSDIGSSVSRLIESDLIKKNIFEVRKSNAVEEYMNTLALAQAGLLSEQSLSRKSKDLKIDYLLLGSVYKHGDVYNVHNRVVNVETWEVVHSCSFVCEQPQSAQEKICQAIEANMQQLLSFKDSAEKPGVAVYGFRGWNAAAQAKSTGAHFSDSITTQLGRTNDLSVVEHAFANMVSNEKQLEMAGVINNEAPDMSFKAKGVDYIVSGNIRQFADMLCINWYIKGINAARPGYFGYSEISSDTALDSLAESVARIVNGFIVKKPGYVEIDILPADTMILVNGKEKDNSIKMISLDSGKYTLKFEREGYVAKESKITIDPGITKKIKVRMEKPEEKTGEIKKENEEADDGKTEWEKKIWKEYENRNAK